MSESLDFGDVAPPAPGTLPPPPLTPRGCLQWYVDMASGSCEHLYEMLAKARDPDMQVSIGFRKQGSCHESFLPSADEAKDIAEHLWLVLRALLGNEAEFAGVYSQ